MEVKTFEEWERGEMLEMWSKMTTEEKIQYIDWVEGIDKTLDKMNK